MRARALDGAVILLPGGERLPAAVAATGRIGWILTPEGCAARALLQRTLLAANIRMRVAVETYTYELQLALVARGRGLSLVPARILARSPLRSRLRVRRIPGLDFPLTIWAVRAPGAPDLEGVWSALDGALTKRLSGARRHS